MNTLTPSQALTLRRPGIYFQEINQPAQFELPNLDVAAFVGFAERGPLDVPVAIEDVDTFTAVFGGDLAIARKAGGAVRYASLPAAVADFFANRGRRCYVVRVAGQEAAASQFCLPGIVGVEDQDVAGSTEHNLSRITVEAAWPGKWSNSLRLATQLRVTALNGETLELSLHEGGLIRLVQTNRSGLVLETGELLRLTLDDELTQLLVVAEEVPDEELTAAERNGDGSFYTLANNQAWLQLSSTRDLLAALGEAGPPDEGAAGAVVEVSELQRLTCLDSEAFSIEGLLWAGSEEFARGDRKGFHLCLPNVSESNPLARLLVGDLVQLTVTRSGSPDEELNLLMAVESIEVRAGPQSPPVDSFDAIQIKASALLMPVRNINEILSSPLTHLAHAERLRFDLLLQDGDEQRTLIQNLGFNSAHPRFWGDVILLESSPLFREGTEADRTYIAEPNHRKFRAEVERYRALREPLRRPQLEDVEPGAEEEKVVALAGILAPYPETGQTFLPLGMAPFFDIEHLTGPLPASLGHDGLSSFNAGLFLDHQLVPNPTAQSRTGTSLEEQALHLYSIEQRRLRGIHSLYPLEEVALIAAPDAIHVGWTPAETLPPLPPPETEPQPEPDRAQFQSCAAEQAAEDDYIDEHSSPNDEEGTSDPALPELSVPEDLRQFDRFDQVYSELFDLHHGLINLAQSRRDWVAMLTLPEHFEARHCTEWAAQLRLRLGLPERGGAYRGHGDLADLSYAAVYHPWLFTTDAVGQIRTIPPDGAVCGAIAARSRDRGLWIAPANVPLQNVLGLQPRLSEEDWAELFALGLNLIRAEPLDFRMMSAHTLSDEREWLQLSVRRLLILLRKVALERGADYVFENNGEQLRNAIELLFGRILQRLFERGAFRGRTPQQAYRIVTDESLNTVQERDNGRFFTEIQVAPSQPLEFITVRLLRTVDGQIQVTEIRDRG